MKIFVIRDETSCFTLKPASTKGFWLKMKHET